MDPNAWLQFIQRALQSTETLSFLIVGIALGSIGGFFLGRWSSSHAILMKHFEGQKTRSDTSNTDQLKPTEMTSKTMPIEPGIELAIDLSSDPVSEALWRKVEEYLTGRGIDRSTLMKLKKAMSASGKKIMDSDNRLRIMLWFDGSVCHPVAMIWRAGKNPRVLFPEGTEVNVSSDQLEELTGKF